MAQNTLRKWGVKDHADHAVRHSSPWVGKLARLGCLAKGFVYLAIGFLALREALGVGGRTTDPSGAMKSIGSQPFGGVMLVLLVADLLCYALWKLVQGVMDADDKGPSPHGIVRRVGYVGSAAIHGTLAFTAAQSILAAEDTSEDAATASALAYQPPWAGSWSGSWASP